MNLKPYGERIIVKKREITSNAGLYLPDKVKDQSLIGDVIAIGSEVEWAEVGDVVLFARHAGFKLPDDAHLKEYDRCILMNDNDLLAKLED